MNLLPPTTPQFGLNYATGWIGFLQHTTFVSRGIEWFTRYWRAKSAPAVSHVFVVTGDTQCVEANADGVDVESLDEYFGNPACTVFLRRPRGWTPELGDRIAQAALKYKGIPYDYELIAADALSYSLVGHLVNGVTGDALDNVLTDLADSDHEMICDKLAILALQAQSELHPLGTLTLPARENNPQRLFTDDTLFEPEVTQIKGHPANLPTPQPPETSGK